MSARAARKGLAAAALIAAALVVVGDPAVARPRFLSLQQDEPAAEAAAPAQRDGFVPVQRQGGVSLQQATSMALSRFQGRVVKAEPVQAGDRLVYEIRIIGEDGRTVRTFRIDAQTGAFL